LARHRERVRTTKTRSKHRWALLLVLLLAAAPRLVWYRSNQPDLAPDTFGYLNVAREWRGEQAPPLLFDEQSMLPWNNQAARTPGYPLFLDLIFAATGHSPTPDAALVGPRRALVRGDPARERHLRHLETDENVRAVQAVQHALAVAATGWAFGTLMLWTGSAVFAAVGALLAIGWNPIWIVMFEPALLTETLAGSVLIATIWVVSRRARSARADIVASLACGIALIVRPAMLFSSIPVLAHLTWRSRDERLTIVSVWLPFLLIAALLIVNNGLRYRYWGVSSITGAALFSHTTHHPEWLREPVRERAEKFRGNVFGGQTLEYLMVIEDKKPYLEIARRIQTATLWYIVDHPITYLLSVADAVTEFCSPTLRLFPGEVNTLRDRLPMVWRAVIALEGLLVIAGLTAWLLPVPPAAKLASAIFVVSAIGTGLLAHTENRRFAVPIVPVVIMSGVTAFHDGFRRIAGRAVGHSR
jgi:hypothetical protein